MKTYDLRSDTVTLPSREMRKLMAKADVGDDVYGEDATINKLEELAAKITGKREALFIPSGSMGNLIPLYINGGRGNEVLSQMNSHIFHYELASATSIAGVMPVAVKGERGILRPEELEKHLRPASYLMPRITMIEIENTHNREGGTCYTYDQLKAVSDFARKHGFSLHMDGARMFNASVATGLPVKRMCSLVDTVTFCLSKGLGAPVGSLLCGPSKFIAEARRVRKMLGGGMRQAGIIASAGIYALENNIQRLKDDHANAKRIADTLSALEWANIDSKNVETNIIYFATPAHPAEQIVAQLKKKGVLCSAFGSNAIRMVTHLGITSQDVDEVCRLLREVKV
ncbi:MAG: aminotransferase class I/II-fold pyridoxal phosphate-dependent enzyme [Spirochaetaceae bacterium]|nr:aminotransferase class I/II-fold pyridoxal phosphate-dependent enzyme [Spirochaetia bacterium]MCF7951218.1 aminotransferase class I/II-fold pyridoxal phosphate-dependent enzyme [Spirochaetaceae bacterium]